MERGQYQAGGAVLIRALTLADQDTGAGATPGAY